MNAKEFAERLSQCAPAKADLLQKGLSDDEAGEVMESHICVRRGPVTPSRTPLLDLRA